MMNAKHWIASIAVLTGVSTANADTMYCFVSVTTAQNAKDFLEGRGTANVVEGVMATELKNGVGTSEKLLNGQVLRSSFAPSGKSKKILDYKLMLATPGSATKAEIRALLVETGPDRQGWDPNPGSNSFMYEYFPIGSNPMDRTNVSGGYITLTEFMIEALTKSGAWTTSPTYRTKTPMLESVHQATVLNDIRNLLDSKILASDAVVQIGSYTNCTRVR